MPYCMETSVIRDLFYTHEINSENRTVQLSMHIKHFEIFYGSRMNK